MAPEQVSDVQVTPPSVATWKASAVPAISVPETFMLPVTTMSPPAGASVRSPVPAGAMVSEGKTILRLPNLSKMRADVEVHESKVDRIRPGMPATIRVQGRSFTGEVTTVANRPQSNWLSTAKKYVVEVRIDGNTEALRPGFTAEVEIIVADLQDVIAVPVAAVIEQQGEYLAAVRQGDRI